MLSCQTLDYWAVDHSEGLALACLTWESLQGTGVFSISNCHSFGFQTLILSFPFSLSWMRGVMLLPFGSYTSWVYCSPVLDETFVYLLTCMHADTSVWISVSLWAFTATHTGLVKACPNPERPESRGRVLDLGPLQLATGSPDSNNRVAFQLQGTAKLFPQRSRIGGKWVIMGSEIEWMITALQTSSNIHV